MTWQFCFWVYQKQGLRGIFVYTYIFIATLCAQRGSNPKCSSMDEWIKKCIGTCNGIILSLKKEENSVTCYNVGECWGHFVKWNMSDTEGQIRYNSTSVKYLDSSQSQRRTVGARAQGGGGYLGTTGRRDSVSQDEVSYVDEQWWLRQDIVGVLSASELYM